MEPGQFASKPALLYSEISSLGGDSTLPAIQLNDSVLEEVLAEESQRSWDVLRSQTHTGSGWHMPAVEDLDGVIPGCHIESLIARGGMGAVYRAWQTRLERLVAVKLLPGGDALDGDEMAERFKREAQAMAKLEHPAILRVYEFGETQAGGLYFVMEYIDGCDVAAAIRAQGRLELHHAVTIGCHVCEALQFAHDRSVIHRDIKPSNIMLNRSGGVKVADFGLAKITDAGLLTLTRPDATCGTPDFLAPELSLSSARASARSDIFSLGVSLYQMVTGTLPRAPYLPPSRRVPGLDPRLDALIGQALAQRVEDRFASAEAMRTKLLEILTPPSTSPLPPTVLRKPPAMPVTVPLRLMNPNHPGALRSEIELTESGPLLPPKVLIFSALVVLLAIGLFFGWSRYWFKRPVPQLARGVKATASATTQNSVSESSAAGKEVIPTAPSSSTGKQNPAMAQAPAPPTSGGGSSSQSPPPAPEPLPAPAPMPAAATKPVPAPVPAAATTPTPALVTLPPSTGWPAFRGLSNGVAPALQVDPASALLREVWKIPTPAGFSSFAVAGSRAFTVVTRSLSLDNNGEKLEVTGEALIAVDIGTGQECWGKLINFGPKYSNGGARGEAGNDGGDGPRSTPAVSEGKVYVIDVSLTVHCLDAADGKIIWKRDIIAQNAGRNISFGNGASPVIDGDVLLLAGGGTGQAMLGLDKNTGAVKWKVGDDMMTHATPVLATIHGMRQCIYFTQQGLVSVDPQKGDVLWRAAMTFKTASAASPVVFEDLVYCSAGYDIGGAAFRIMQSGKNFVAVQIWRREGRTLSHWSTPVVHDGYLYGIFRFTEYGKAPLSCVDIRTGSEKWSQPGFGQGQVILSGDTIIALTDRGEIVYLKADRSRYKELKRKTIITGKVWSYPVLADRFLFARSTVEGGCWELK